MSPPPVRLSVSDPPPQAQQASRQSLMGHHGIKIFDNRKKNLFSANDNRFSRKNDFNIPICNIPRSYDVRLDLLDKQLWDAMIFTMLMSIAEMAGELSYILLNG